MHRVVILGCGDAGLVAAAYLNGTDGTDVTVVSEREFHVFSYLLYHVIEGRSLASTRLDLPRTFQDTDVRFIQGLVEDLDIDAGRIDLRSGSLQFDTLLIALGGVTKYSIDDRRHVQDIRTDVRTIRRGIQSPDVDDVVIVGGGPIGVETTATISSVTDPGDVTLVTASDRLLPTFPPRASTIAEDKLRQRDVSFRMETRVREVTEGRVILEGKPPEQSDLTIWAGGIQPNPVIDRFGLSTTERGLCVDSELRCVGTRNVFAAGDVVAYPDKVNDGFSAGLEARTAAKNIRRRSRGRRLQEHRIRWHPRIIYLGRDAALLVLNGVVHYGRIPALLRAVAARGYSASWKYLW